MTNRSRVNDPPIIAQKQQNLRPTIDLNDYFLPTLAISGSNKSPFILQILTLSFWVFTPVSLAGHQARLEIESQFDTLAS